MGIIFKEQKMATRSRSNSTSSKELRQGKKLLKNNDFLEGVKMLESAYEHDTESIDCSYYYGNALVLSGSDIKKGVEILRSAKQNPKRDADVSYALGYGLLRLKQPKEAIAPLEDAKRLYEKGGNSKVLQYAKALNRLAEAKLFGAKDRNAASTLISESLAILKRTKATGTVHVRALLVHAQVFYAQGMYDDSKEEAKRALEMAEDMKHKDAILIAEIKEFINPSGYNLKIPAAVSAVACMGFAVAMTVM